MARGKYLSLKEARKMKRLDRFAKEHPSEGDKKLFNRLLDAMARVDKPEVGERTSRKKTNDPQR